MSDVISEVCIITLITFIDICRQGFTQNINAYLYCMSLNTSPFFQWSLVTAIDLKSKYNFDTATTLFYFLRINDVIRGFTNFEDRSL